MSDQVRIRMTVDALSLLDPNTFFGARCIENTAILCHEANRGFCQSTGDSGQKPFHLATEHTRASCKEGILHLLDDLRNHRDVEPGESHARWIEYKLADGWKVGPIKNEEKKEHPNLVPFEKLPIVEQAKDHIYVAIAKRALELYGFRIAFARLEPEEVTVKLRTQCTDRMFDIGTMCILGGATQLAEVATQALADVFGHPYARIPGLSNTGIMHQALDCFREPTVEDAYETYRASYWPDRFLPPFATLSQLERSHWHVMHAITSAIAMIHGVYFTKRGDVETTWSRP